MSQEARQADVRDQSQKLVDGPLKHIRAAALAAALVPLASVMAAPASAQTLCPAIASAGICGTVFNDLNNNGIQDVGEQGIPSLPVVVTDSNGTNTLFTDSNGMFISPDSGGAVTVSVAPPTGFQISMLPQQPCNVVCSSGELSNGSSVVNTFGVGESINFGFFQNNAANPGTGTIGFWKNHPDAWPDPTIVVAGKTYTVAQAITVFNKVGKDKSTMMFAQLVAAELSVKIGNDSSCIAPTIKAADVWLMTYPVGSNVAGSSQAWSGSGNGATLEGTLDAYNNGQLCAPHRQ